MTNTENAKKEKLVKEIIKFAVGGLVELFVGALTNSVVGRVEGTKIAKLSAKAGGFLVGMYIGDQVSEYIIAEADGAFKQFQELKETIDKESEV